MKLKHKTPCDECPFLKKSTPGYFGGNDPQTYFSLAHGESGVSCHKTAGKKSEAYCVGSIQHATKAFKLYRNPTLRKLQNELGKNPDVLSLREFFEHHAPGELEKRKAAK